MLIQTSPRATYLFLTDPCLMQRGNLHTVHWYRLAISAWRTSELPQLNYERLVVVENTE